MKDLIIIEPRGGLANRMRVIASGLWLSDKVNRNIQLIWNIDSEMNCPFNVLFESIQEIELINKKKKPFLLRSAKQKSVLKRLIIGFINFVIKRKFIIIGDSEVKKINNGELDILTLGKTKKILHFYTYEEFGNNQNEYRRFMIKSDLQQQIDEYCNQFNPKTIGVHIRRTDNMIAIAQSPTERFIKRITNDLQNDPEINYFLATDDKETENQITSLFGNKIITREKDYSRDNSPGIKDALIDIYCLSNTTRIYGSYWSSFSEVAARIKGIHLEQLRIDEEA